MTEKLRPEQRKLWRRIYLTAFDGGANAKDAAYEADLAISQWDKRGAFEADPLVAPSDGNMVEKTPTTWDDFAREVSIKLRDGRTNAQIAVLRSEYQDEFDFMRALVA